MRPVPSGATNLPLAEFRHPWDAATAKQRVFAWAGFDGDSPDPAKARRAFFIHDADNPTNKTGYKLPFADIVDGQLRAVPAGLSAVLGALRGARTSLKAPGNVKGAVKAKLNTYFTRMKRDKPFNDIPHAIRRAAKSGLLKVQNGIKVDTRMIGIAARLANNVYSEADKAAMVEYFKVGKPGSLRWELHGGIAGLRWVK